jgi:hypothetical protein
MLAPFAFAVDFLPDGYTFCAQHLDHRAATGSALRLFRHRPRRIQQSLSLLLERACQGVLPAHAECAGMSFADPGRATIEASVAAASDEIYVGLLFSRFVPGMPTIENNGEPALTKSPKVYHVSASYPVRIEFLRRSRKCAGSGTAAIFPPPSRADSKSARS